MVAALLTKVTFYTASGVGAGVTTGVVVAAVGVVAYPLAASLTVSTAFMPVVTPFVKSPSPKCVTTLVASGATDVKPSPRSAAPAAVATSPLVSTVVSAMPAISPATTYLLSSLALAPPAEMI